MSRRHIGLGAALMAAAFLLASSAESQAYVALKTWSGKNKLWQQSTVTWTVSNAGMPGMTNDQFQAALAGAFDAWDDVACGTLGFSFGGVKASNPLSGIHVKVQKSNWDPSVGDALAYAMSDTNQQGKILSSDVVFNAADTEWSTAPGGSFGKSDVQGVGTHEIGHAIGLDHTRHFESTMFFSGGSIDLRTLEEDDQNGLCYLYPAVPFTSGKPCDTCHTSDHCENGYCLDFGGGNGFCSADCTSSAQCPEGFSCFFIADSIPNQCLPDNDACHQGGSNIALGDFCYGHQTCSSGLCLVVPDDAYCSKSCTSSCPAGFTCNSGYCFKAGNKPYGSDCAMSSECATGTCVFLSLDSGICTQTCGLNGGACPDGNQCLQDVYCVPPGPGANGAPCISPTQCAGTYCELGQCTQPCGAGAPCPEGTSCGAEGYCVGAVTGGGCDTSLECPQGLACHKASQHVDGVCIQPCSPLTDQGCFEGDVCQWHWEAWTETIAGACVNGSQGGEEGASCDPAGDDCRADLLCAWGVYDTWECHRDCKLFANSLGCTVGQKCLSLEEPDDPKHGYCVLKNPPPPPHETPDGGRTPAGDAGPIPGDGWAGYDGDGGTGPWDPPDDPAAPGNGNPVGGTSSGGGGGCQGAAPASGSLPWTLALLLGWWRIRRRVSTSAQP